MNFKDSGIAECIEANIKKKINKANNKELANVLKISNLKISNFSAFILGDEEQKIESLFNQENMSVGVLLKFTHYSQSETNAQKIKKIIEDLKEALREADENIIDIEFKDDDFQQQLVEHYAPSFVTYSIVYKIENIKLVELMLKELISKTLEETRAHESLYMSMQQTGLVKIQENIFGLKHMNSPVYIILSVKKKLLNSLETEILKNIISCITSLLELNNYQLFKIDLSFLDKEKEVELTGELYLSDDYINYAVIPIENELFTTEEVLKEFHKKGY